MPESSEQSKIERGQEAMRFLQYIQENPYYKSVLEEIDSELMREVSGLDPKEKERWSLIQSARVALYMGINRVYQDVEIGRKADSQEGTTPKGIL